LDLRQKVKAALDRGMGSQRAVAALFGVRLAFVERRLQRHRTSGSLAPLPHAGGPPRRLDLGDAQVIRQRLEHQPDRTLDERGEAIAHQRGKLVSRATRGRAVQRLNLPRKKRSSTRPSVTPIG
jgi:transposase